MSADPKPPRFPGRARQRRAISLAGPARDLVLVQAPAGPGFSPVLVRPAAAGVELAAWIEGNRAAIHEMLLIHGAVRFRGFEVRTPEDFWTVVEAHGAELMHYAESATPRVEVADKLYTSTEFPAAESIFLHNENSTAAVWPMKLWLFCQEPAERGGETPLADVRRVYQRIPGLLRERFLRRGWAVVRNYGDGFGLSWETAFATDDRADAERYCRQHGIEFEWKADNRLRTVQRRPAIRRHPETGEPVWFNHMAFWHVSGLAPAMRRTLEAEFAPSDLPFNTYYGDLEPIDDATVGVVRDAYLAEAVAEPWQQGDVVLVDNMLVAHGRRPFEGRRRVLVMMGNPCAEGG